MDSISQNKSVTVLEECRVAPASTLPELSLPLTFFDTKWLRFPAVEQIFFYQLTGLTRTHFDSAILPNLKRSLSLTLVHFSPLAGRLTWPPHGPKPSILYRPGHDDDDYVSLMVAVSKEPESFERLAGSKPHKAAESHLYTPELRVTDSEAAIMSIQVTLFPDHGIAIAASIHHAVLDGKSVILFFKAWAHVCKQLESSNPSLEEAAAIPLPPELTPVLDRSLVQDPEAVYTNHLENWSKIGVRVSDNPRSLQLLPKPVLDQTLVRANFELSLLEVRKLREQALSKLGTTSTTTRLSTFVLVLSYSLSCLVRAKNIGSSEKILCVFAADCRTRMDPRLPENYSGNCLAGVVTQLDARVVIEDGFAVVAKSIGESIEEFRNLQSVHQLVKQPLVSVGGGGATSQQRQGLVVTVAGAPRLGFYRVDFGWGRPAKMEVASIDATGAISMEEGSSGGVEIGLVLTEDEMETFGSLFPVASMAFSSLQTVCN